jgi:hypothetical protein
MSQPAPDWSQTPAPAPTQPPPAPTPLAGPVAPPPPGTDGAPVVVQLPTDPAAMLDAGVALQHARGPIQPTMRTAAEAEQLNAPGGDVTQAPTVQVWWSPGTALVLSMAAVSWQLVSYYARVQLPLVEASGGQLTYFDLGVRSLPLAGSSFGVVPGLMLAAAAVGILVYGARRGLRDPVLQLIVGMLAAVAIMLASLLPMIAA